MKGYNSYKNIPVLAAGLLAMPSVTHQQFAQQDTIKSPLSVFEQPSFVNNDKFNKAEWVRNDNLAMNETDLIQYTKTSFCYDKDVYIDFYEPLLLSFKQGHVTLQPSGVSFECRNILDFDDDLTRFMQHLMDKALKGDLNKEEKTQWLALLNMFDYNKFRLDYAPPLYEKFIVRSISKFYVKIERISDRKCYSCPISISPIFSNGRIRKADKLGAYVKRNHNDTIVSLSNPHLVTDDFLTDDEINKMTII